MLQNKKFIPLKQNQSGSSYFGKIKKKDRLINLGGAKEEVYNKVRALSLPYEGAYYNDYIIWETSFIDSREEMILMKIYPMIGIYFDEKDETLLLRLSDGVLISEDFELLKG